MRRFNFQSMALIAVLLVTFASCTALQETAGGYEEAPSRRRVYSAAPYGYGGQQVIILERDPYTGQYYQVTPFGYNSPYGFGYDPFLNRGAGVYRGGRVIQQPRQQPQQPQRRGSESTDRAKDIIRGN